MTEQHWHEPALATRLDWLGSEFYLRRDDAARLRNEARRMGHSATAEAICAAMALADAAILALARARREEER